MQATKGPEGEERYSFNLALTSVLDKVGGQRHAPAALAPGKTRCPLYRRLGGPLARSGGVRKLSPSPGFDSRTVQPVASSLKEIVTGLTSQFKVYGLQIIKLVKF